MIPADIKKILLHLEKSGVKSYIVGGGVRDMLMEKAPEDYDVAAECFPEELCRIFEGYKSFDNGIRFGTLSVFSGERYVEITCCRREGQYTDLRRPDSVEYCKDITEDLARRDFTVNAMAMDADENIIDPFGGEEDLKKGIIRAVGEPSRRFGEDALRIMRALRFSSSLSFDIEENTKKALKESRELLLAVAGERIFAELKKLLCGENARSVLLEYKEEICTVIPELSDSVGFEQNNVHHIYDVYEHMIRSVAASPKDVNIRLCMLLHDIAKPSCYFEDEDKKGHFYGHPKKSAEIAREILCRLHADGETVKEVCFLIENHDIRPEVSRRSMHRYVSKVGFDGALKLVAVRRADLSAQSPEFHGQFEMLDKSEELILALKAEGACTKISDLAVDGNDLKELGLSGRKIGEALNFLLEKVVSGQTENNRSALLSLIK